jgi:hypothetical protein
MNVGNMKEISPVPMFYGFEKRHTDYQDRIWTAKLSQSTKQDFGINRVFQYMV